MLYLGVCGIMLCENETRQVKEVDVTILEKNDARMLRKMCSVRSEDMISVAKLKKKTGNEYHNGLFTEYSITIVWSSRKNGKEFLT